MAASLYERLGGRDVVERIVGRFYAGVADDPVLRPLYPADLAAAERRLALFLVQFTGGPHDYERERGHPRLRLRHFAFSIGTAERDAWIGLMSDAVAAEVGEPALADELLASLRKSADFLVNQGLRLGVAPKGPSIR